jgi:hypothetical protein
MNVSICRKCHQQIDAGDKHECSRTIECSMCGETKENDGTNIGWFRHAADQWWLVPYCSDECVKTSFKFLQESGNDPFEAKKLAKIAKLKLDGTKLGDNK